LYQALVLKLNENRFKPLFLKMVEWASARDDAAASLAAMGGKGKTATNGEDSEEQLHVMCRQVVLCRVIEALGQRLKAIMVPYFSYVMGFLLLIISSRRAVFHPLPLLFSAPTVSAPEKAGKKRGRPAASENGTTDPCKQLGEEGVEWAVAALHKCFLYDTLGFVTKERFEALHTPLLNLIQDSHLGEEVYSKRVDTYLKPAIVQLAVAVQGSTGSTMLWKPLNHQLLMRTRHDAPMVRYAALQITKALVERLGEEYLTLVPETLPFVVEVLEDTDEQVEAAARSLVAVLEALLGESLNEYLTQ
jgi:U3 small nucleolar RNA-associated protein 10